MMNIGDRVISKKTGPVAQSTIYAIFSAHAWKAIQLAKGKSEITRWDELYPNWYEEGKLVYLSLFDEPVKIVSYQEYCDNLESNLDPFLVELRKVPSLYKLFLERQYELQPEVYELSYPEDDLELV